MNFVSLKARGTIEANIIQQIETPKSNKEKVNNKKEKEEKTEKTSDKK